MVHRTITRLDLWPIGYYDMTSVVEFEPGILCVRPLIFCQESPMQYSPSVLLFSPSDSETGNATHWYENPRVLFVSRGGRLPDDGRYGFREAVMRSLNFEPGLLLWPMDFHFSFYRFTADLSFTSTTFSSFRQQPRSFYCCSVSAYFVWPDFDNEASSQLYHTTRSFYSPARPMATSRRCPATLTQPCTDVSSPKKRALLIGINYANAKAQVSDTPFIGREPERPEDPRGLKGPHQDVEDMKKLLMSVYGYNEADIVVMKDDGVNQDLQPTRTNMICEMIALVKDARPDDRFFFHYAGHTTQRPNMSGGEEDGMDECLIPCDDPPTEQTIIMDNDLRKYLVDSLPVGCHLVAVLDSCHSASLLDLEHFRCNRVYVPWISKGRRKSDSVYDSIVRRNAMLVTRTVYQSDRVSSQLVKSRKTSLGRVVNASNASNRLSISMKSSEMKSEFANWIDSPTSIFRCDSPLSMFPCNGFCPRLSGQDDVAEVVSLSACQDDQLCWEDDDGASMTRVLIDLLGRDPHPQYHQLMTLISHRLHSTTVKMHATMREYKRKIKKWELERGKPYRRHSSEGLIIETNNFQDPQLSSHLPLDMNARWRV